MMKLGLLLLGQRIWRRLMTALAASRTGEVCYINGPETLPPPLSREEEQKVFEALQRAAEKPVSS